ncbi:MAG: endonuclease [Paludibacteraceae bacterium]|nr:endonuclease [Paludibacteraceae bacterium]
MRIRNVLFLFLVAGFSKAQIAEKKPLRIMCYNVENYFDCVNDTTTLDEEYLSGGMRGWNYAKYQQKQANIGKVITALGGWEAPALVGLCEVESERALRDLTVFSGLKSLKYKFIHYESPDARGIDVALLYQRSMFKPIISRSVTITNPQFPESKTRDLLYAAGRIPSGDTLHVFVCHFPSRLGGELESENKRMFVASVLRASVDSVCALNHDAAIVIMGDFNDYPDNKSMQTILGANPPEDKPLSNKLYNLMFPIHVSGKGSHKHAGEWGALDQIIVSGSLLNMKKHVFTTAADAHIFEAPFLLDDDQKFLGKQPARTYVGMTYKGGFSDHLPVFVDLWY